MATPKRDVLRIVLLTLVIAGVPIAPLVSCLRQNEPGETGLHFTAPTTQQAAAGIAAADTIGAAIAAGTGNPLWAVIIDLLAKITALMLAWFLPPPKAAKAAVVVESG
jgi:hypothetical protein